MEALVTNYIAVSTERRKESQAQYMLLETPEKYVALAR